MSTLSLLSYVYCSYIIVSSYVKMAVAMMAGLQDLYLDIMTLSNGEEIGRQSRVAV